MRETVLSRGDMLERRFQEIKRLVFTGGVTDAQDVLRQISEEFPRPTSSLNYVRARMYEDGVFGRLDVDAAIKDFRFLAQGDDDLVVEGLIGLARMLYKKDSLNNVDEVIELCKKVFLHESNPMAMMLIAAVYEDTKHDYRAAKRWSFRAFTRRSPWGLRYRAVMLYRRKKHVFGILFEVAAFLVNPLMKKKYRIRGPFK